MMPSCSTAGAVVTGCVLPSAGVDAARVSAEVSLGTSNVGIR